MAPRLATACATGTAIEPSHRRRGSTSRAIAASCWRQVRRRLIGTARAPVRSSPSIIGTSGGTNEHAQVVRPDQWGRVGRGRDPGPIPSPWPGPRTGRGEWKLSLRQMLLRTEAANRSSAVAGGNAMSSGSIKRRRAFTDRCGPSSRAARRWRDALEKNAGNRCCWLISRRNLPPACGRVWSWARNSSRPPSATVRVPPSSPPRACIGIEEVW